MVDRYQSLIEDSQFKSRKNNSSILLQDNNRQLNELIKQTQTSSTNMKKYIGQYRDATTSNQQQQILTLFRNQQQKLHQSRQILTREYKSMSNNINGKQSSQKIILKQHLLKTVQKQLKLDVEMNQLISRKENKLEIQMKKLQPGSQKLQNALTDLNQKRNQIVYLRDQVKECVQLLDIIGVLVLENSEKIQLALQDIKNANQQINRSLKNIQQAKIRTQRSRKRKCFIIIIGLVVIIVILAVVFGLKLFPI